MKNKTMKTAERNTLLAIIKADIMDIPENKDGIAYLESLPIARLRELAEQQKPYDNY